MKNIYTQPFTTPPKELCNRTIINSTPREGDWICLNCNNLNFAFRKRCNRCKHQTREQNQLFARNYYYSYTPKYNQYENQPLSNITNSAINKNHTRMTTPEKRRIDMDLQKQNHNSTKLPSVSPLLKKYAQNQKNKNSTTAKSFNETENFGCSPLCWDNQWPNATLEFGEEDQKIEKIYLQEEQQVKYDAIDNQIQEMITRIII